MMKPKTRLTPQQVGETIERIATAEHTSEDIDRLISHLYSAADISALTLLLDSSDVSTIRDGIYILSELGKSGRPLRERARALLKHRDTQIRYWAMNSVVSCFEAQAAKDAIRAAGLLDDPDEFVRTRASEMVAALQ